MIPNTESLINESESFGKFERFACLSMPVEKYELRQKGLITINYSLWKIRKCVSKRFFRCHKEIPKAESMITNLMAIRGCAIFLQGQILILRPPGELLSV